METTAKRNRIYRQVGIELRTVDGGGDLPVISGCAAPFNKLSQLLYGSFYEKIAPGYFDEALKRDDLDVRAIDNHNPMVRYARLCPAKNIRSIELFTDAEGLQYRIQPANTQAGRDLVVDIQAGNIDAMSIGHWVEAEDQDGTIDGYPVRRLLRCKKIDDISFATYAAYLDTSAELRAAQHNEMTAADYKALLNSSTIDSATEMRKRKTFLANLDRR
jgi:uncharacterized protein